MGVAHIISAKWTNFKIFITLKLVEPDQNNLVVVILKRVPTHDKTKLVQSVTEWWNPFDDLRWNPTSLSVP